MIVFLNGTFGVGKTTIATQLLERLPGSLLFDAELVGQVLRQIVAPIEKPTDFQDLTLWRSLTATTAQQLRVTYGRTLIMPMTIWRLDYFNEVVGSLRACEPALHHFTLTALPLRRMRASSVSDATAGRSNGGCIICNAAPPPSRHRTLLHIFRPMTGRLSRLSRRS